MQGDAEVHGVAHEPIRTGAHDLVALVHLELEVVVAAEREYGPDRESDAPQGEDHADDRKPPGRLELGAEPQRDEDVWHPGERRERALDAAAPSKRLAAAT